VGTTIVSAVNVLATYDALLLMDSCGRKLLILRSSGGMFLACILLVLSLLEFFNNIMALLAVNIYVCFFEIGLGPIPWLIVAKMFEGKYAAVAMPMCIQVNWATLETSLLEFVLVAATHSMKQLLLAIVLFDSHYNELPSLKDRPSKGCCC
jgi:hypothetical protein